MVLEIANVANVGVVAAGRRAAAALGRPATEPAITPEVAASAPATAVSGRFVEIRAQLNRADTRTALNIAVTAGTGILSALKDLRDGFEVAASSLSTPSVNLINRNGSRVSVLNFQAQAGILLRAIDRLVGEAEVGGANLISSKGVATRLATTIFGGGVNVDPQPLDSVGLGLADVNLLAVGGVNDGLASVNEAIILAEQRLRNLEALQRVVGGTATVSSQVLSAALSGFGAGSLDRGTLVDLIG